MREHATQKLSQAYHLDEIAASVATMQSASALEEVAKHVLQRNQTDPAAEYVHFFHEKIPSRALAESTSLAPLNDIIRQQPTDPAPYRTRAVTRVFKDDFEGAVRDLTDGLALYRLYHPPHQNGQRELILAKDAAKLAREYRADTRVDEKDQPSSLEPQLLFHRGGAYLTLACSHVEHALPGSPRPGGGGYPSPPCSADGKSSTTTEADHDDSRARAEARKLVRTYAKRALRDYTSFLSHFEYTPGLSAEFTEAFLHKVSSVTSGGGPRSRSERLLDLDARPHSGLAEALVRYESQRDHQNGHSLPQIPKPVVHKLHALFAAVPPADLPVYPPDPASEAAQEYSHFSLPDFSEAVTYHPLLTDVLHSLLLCHCLIQTSGKEHLRHAYMAARIARVCDGYPIFLAARSPARADWIEVLRRSKNWLGLQASWESLCAPAPLPGHMRKNEATNRAETAEEKRERMKEDVIRDALADDRVVDEDTFRASVRARELRAAREEEEEQRKEYCRTTSSEAVRARNGDTNVPPPRRWAQEDGKEYPITTERAELIVRWIREAPAPSASDGSARSKRRTGAKGRLQKKASTASSLRETDTGLEHSIESLDIVD